MGYDISGFGTRIQLQASVTFPASIGLTQFADDSDPIDVTTQEIMDSAMGLNGDLVTWSTAKPIKFNLSFKPDDDDDKNLSILLEANRPGKNKRVARDKLQMVVSYPNGILITLTNGKISAGQSFTGIQSAGRMKSKTYTFVFENVIKAVL